MPAFAFGTGVCCIDCLTPFRPRKNGVRVCETMEDGKPYKIWQADLLECPDCGKQIVTGFGSKHISEHFEDDFNVELQLVTITINARQKSLN